MINDMCKNPALLLALGIFLTGCATSFQGGELSKVKSFPDVRSPKSASVDLVFTGKLNGKPWKTHNIQNTAYLKQQCLEHMTESGLFGSVSSPAQTADLNIQIAIINEKTAVEGFPFLSALTLFIYPNISSDNFRMLAVVKDNRTGVSNKIHLEDSVNYYQQIFLTPLALFKSHNRGLEACRSRLFDNLCLEIQKTGMLD